jgi:hypothetical protein
MRVAGGRAIQQKNGSPAWVYKIADAKPGAYVPPPKPEPPRMTSAQVQDLIREYRRDLTSDRLASASKSLGITADSLRAYGIGWCRRYNAYSFPMFDGKMDPIGIRLRMESGRKICVPGSRNGLFIPADYSPYPIILAPEGLTDAAACHDLGYCAVGRPDNAGGSPMFVELMGKAKPHVVVIPDRDVPKHRPGDERAFFPGVEGAINFCQRIMASCGSLRFMVPPDGAKDMRKWHNDVKDMWEKQRKIEAAIMKSPLVTAAWLMKAKARIEGMRVTKTS